MSKKQELYDFISSLTDEEVEKIVARLPELKEAVEKETPKAEPPKRQRNPVVTETPLPFQKRGDGVPFQRMKR